MLGREGHGGQDVLLGSIRASISSHRLSDTDPVPPMA